MRSGLQRGDWQQGEEGVPGFRLSPLPGSAKVYKYCYDINKSINKEQAKTNTQIFTWLNRMLLRDYVHKQERNSFIILESIEFRLHRSN